MIPQGNSKEVIYQFRNTKSFLNGVKKFHAKRMSNDLGSGTKLCLYKSNSNSETADTKFSGTAQKEKKLCIKFKDLVAVEGEGEESNDDNLELALKIKKRRYTNNPKKIYICNNKINLGTEKEKEEENKKRLKTCKSMSKVIIGDDSKDNGFIKFFKKKILCC
jgi:hypothetical protein